MLSRCGILVRKGGLIPPKPPYFINIQEYKVFDLTNTICKIAQKRSLITAVLCTVGASEFFTQDLEDIDVEPEPKNNRKVRNITTKTHQSHDKSSTKANSLSPEDWYERGRNDAKNNQPLKYEKAEQYYQQSLERSTQLFGEEHPDVALSMNNLASLYEVLDKDDEAEALYLKALEISIKVSGESAPNTTIIKGNYQSFLNQKYQ